MTKYKESINYARNNKQKIFWTLVLIIIFYQIFSYDWDGIRELEWKEEVELPSGEVIWIKRNTAIKWSAPIAGPGATRILSSQLEIISDIANKPAIWDFPAIPIYIYRENLSNTWIVVATWSDSLGFLKFYKKRPRNWYVRHKFSKGAWLQIEMDMSLLERRVPVNIFSKLDYDGMPNMSLEDKEDRFKGKMSTYYKCITDKPTSVNGCSKKIN